MKSIFVKVIKENNKMAEIERSELMSLKEEYIKLQDHLADSELRYHNLLNMKEDENTVNIDYDRNLHKFVSKLFNKSKYSDIEILLEDGHLLSAHKVILASRSEDWGVEDFFLTDHIDLSDVKYPIAHDVVKWVYTGNIKLKKTEYVIEILKLAVRLRLIALVLKCEEALIPNINEENCKEFLQLSVLLSTDLLDLLKEHCNNLIIFKDEVVNESEQEVDEAFDGEDNVDVNDDSMEQDDSQDGIEETLKFEPDEADDISEKEENSSIEKKGSPKARKVKKSPKKTSSVTKSPKTPSVSTCPVCDEKFQNRAEMRLHKAAAHPGDKPYKCEFCDKSFKKRCSYTIHIRTHTGEKPYICPHCGRGFHDSKCCRSHILTHEGHKPYQCNICGRSFIMRGVLNTHMKQRHFNVDTEKKKERHMCSICGNSFTQKGHLQTHEKIHFGVKAHQCSFCGKSFVEKSAMTRHVRTHTGEKPHKCHVCGNAFIQSVQLRKHMVKHEKQAAFHNLGTVRNPLPHLPLPVNYS